MSPARKKLLYVAGLFVGTALFLELGSALYFRVSERAFLGNAEILAREPGSFVRESQQEECSYGNSLFPHPYLAWVRHANEPCGWDRISRQGLYGPDIPAQREPGIFRILLTGGSVGVQFGFVPEPNDLESVLNERFGTDTRRFEVINAAIEAWKQPQQLFTAIMYGRAVDGIVSLEGFNEFFAILEHSENGRRMDLPWRPSYTATNPYYEQSGASEVASWANQRLYAFSRDHWLGSRSRFALLLTRAMRARFAAWAAAEQKDWSQLPTSLESLFDIDQGRDLDASAWNLELYRHYLSLMRVFSVQSGTQLAIFMQPSPAVSKPISDAEAAVVGDLGYGPQYREMVQNLAGPGDLPIHSLLDIYAEVTDSVYTDPVHQDVNGEGYRMMVDAVVRQLAQAWNLEKDNVQN